MSNRTGRTARAAAVAVAVAAVASACSGSAASTTATSPAAGAPGGTGGTVVAADRDDAGREQHRAPAGPADAAQEAKMLSPVDEPGKTWSSMREYMDFALNDVHAYWVGVEQAAGRPAPTVTYVWPSPGTTYQTAQCPATDDRTMYYCPALDLIAFSEAAAHALWSGSHVAADGKTLGRTVGDFGVAYIIAHEYAHNMQSEYGLSGRYSTLTLERHADCWAGSWAGSAYWAGLLEGTDVTEALETAWVLSDTRHDHERSHGSPDERPADFLLGYNGGHPSVCDALLG